MVGAVNFNLEALLMKIKLHFLCVFKELLRDWDNNGLSRRDPEGPLSSQMLNQDGNETLKRTKHSSVNDDWSGVARLKGMLLPEEVLIIKFVLGKEFRLETRIQVVVLMAATVRLMALFRVLAGSVTSLV